MKTAMSFLNMGLYSPLVGQGLFGGAGVVAWGDSSAGASNLGAQYSLALEQALGRGFATSGFTESRMGHPLFSVSTAINSRHKIVPTFLLSEVATFSPWTEGLRLALGEEGMVTVVASGGWRLAGSDEGIASGTISKLDEMKKWFEQNLKRDSVLKFAEFRCGIQEWSEEDKVDLGLFLGEKLKDADADVRANAALVLMTIVPKLKDESFRKEMAEKIVALLEDLNWRVIEKAALALKKIVLMLGEESLESLIEKVAKIPNEDGNWDVPEVLISMRRRLNSLASEGNPEIPTTQEPEKIAAPADNGGKGTNVSRRDFVMGFISGAALMTGIFGTARLIELFGEKEESDRPAPTERGADVLAALPPEVHGLSALVEPVTIWIEEQSKSRADFSSWEEELYKKIQNWSEEDNLELSRFLTEKLKETDLDVLYGALNVLGLIVPDLKAESFRRQVAERIVSLLQFHEYDTVHNALDALRKIGRTLGKESLESLMSKIEKIPYEDSNQKMKNVLADLKQHLEYLQPPKPAFPPENPQPTPPVEPSPPNPAPRPAPVVKNAESYYKTGSRYYEKGKAATNSQEKKKFFELARTNLERIPELQREKKAWHKLGFVYQELGLFQKSDAAFRKSAE